VVYSVNKSYRHDITEILLKVALNTTILTLSPSNEKQLYECVCGPLQWKSHHNTLCGPSVDANRVENIDLLIGHAWSYVPSYTNHNTPGRCRPWSLSYVPSYTNHNTPADADRGHYLTFLLTLTITPQVNYDRGHDLTFLITLTIISQADADHGHDLTVLLTLTITQLANAGRGHDLTFLLTLTITPRPMPTVVIILRSFLH
jgi:hypothetical protein